MTRPEDIAPPEIFYDTTEVNKYLTNSHIIDIQSQMTERALELLLLPHDNCLILDLGSGCGTSGKVLNANSHFFIGLDISPSMLDAAAQTDVNFCDFILGDMGKTFRFRPGVFDGAISISAIQWLCSSFSKSHNPYKSLCTLFSWLYCCLKPGSRAVFQYYTEDVSQIEMMTSAALKNGFGGGIVIDYPNSTKAKKQYLCLWAGFSGNIPPTLPAGLSYMSKSDSITGPNKVKNIERSHLSKKKSSKKLIKKTRTWILNKKERQRMQNRDVRPDSKYTGRRRNKKF